MAVVTNSPLKPFGELEPQTTRSGEGCQSKGRGRPLGRQNKEGRDRLRWIRLESRSPKGGLDEAEVERETTQGYKLSE